MMSPEQERAKNFLYKKVNEAYAKSPSLAGTGLATLPFSYFFDLACLMVEFANLTRPVLSASEISEWEKAVLAEINGELLSTRSGIIYFNTKQNGVSKNVSVISVGVSPELASMFVKAFNEKYSGVGK